MAKPPIWACAASVAAKDSTAAATQAATRDQAGERRLEIEWQRRSEPSGDEAFMPQFMGILS